MNDGVTNYFVHRSAAERYAAARPYFHPLIAERIVNFTKCSHFGRALDVGCGTGQSSRAIAEIADCVDAVDISADMIETATPHSRVQYRVSPAERLPFANELFDLATVGMAFHWFDQSAFLAEAHRVLKPGAWLVVFNDAFTGVMVGNGPFRDWSFGPYRQKFPQPARREAGVSKDFAESRGFTLQYVDVVEHAENMSAESLASYLSTQSNVIAAVEGGALSITDALSWINSELKPYFASEQFNSLEFKCTIWKLQRTI